MAPELRHNPKMTAKASMNLDIGESSSSSDPRQPQAAEGPKGYIKKDLQHYANEDNMQLPRAKDCPYYSYLLDEPIGQPFDSNFLRTRLPRHRTTNHLPTANDMKYPGIAKFKGKVIPEKDSWDRFIKGPAPAEAQKKVELEKDLLKRNEEAAGYKSYLSNARNKGTTWFSAHRPLPRDHWHQLRLGMNILSRKVHDMKEEKRLNTPPCDCHKKLHHLHLCRCATCPRELRHYTTAACHCVLKDSEIHKEKVEEPKTKPIKLPENPSDKKLKEYEAQEAKIAAEKAIIERKAAKEAAEVKRFEAQLNQLLPQTCGHLNDFAPLGDFQGGHYKGNTFYGALIKLDPSGRLTFDGSEFDIDSFTITPQQIRQVLDEDVPDEESLLPEGSLPAKFQLPAEESLVPYLRLSKKPRTPLPSGRSFNVADFIKERAARKAQEESKLSASANKADNVQEKQKTHVVSVNGSKKGKSPEPTYMSVNGVQKLSIKILSLKRKASTEEESSNVLKKQKTFVSDAAPPTPLPNGLTSRKRNSADQPFANIIKKQKTMAASSSSAAQQIIPKIGNDIMTIAQAALVNVPDEHETSTASTSAANGSYVLNQKLGPVWISKGEGEEVNKEVDPEEVWGSDDTQANIRAKLRLLGLTPNVYEHDTTEAPGMWPRSGTCGSESKDKAPSWSWVGWTILARAPGHHLPLGTIHKLGKEWIPALASTAQQTCRAALTRGDCFINDKTLQQWRLAKDGEAQPPKGAGPGTGTGKAQAKKRTHEKLDDEDD